MTDASNKTFTLTNDQTGESVVLPVLDGVDGPSVIDVRKLYAQTGHFTYDPGFRATGSCDSALTYIDGEQGILLHRGYAIEELANKSDYMEVCYLLLHGNLPSAAAKAEFEHTITHHTMVHDQIHNFFRGFRRDAHPMAIMCVVSSARCRPSTTTTPTSIPPKTG